jgi:hypothetical protein
VVAELLELSDQSAGVGGAVVAAGEPVGSEVLIDGVGFGQDMPDHDDQAVGAGEDGFPFGPLAETALEATELGSEVAIVLAHPGPGRFT